MPVIIPHTYSFDDQFASGTGAGSGGGSLWSYSVPFSDDGINFTWSMESAPSDGSNQTGHYTYYGGSVIASASAGASDVWHLNATGGTGTTDQTQFFGTASNPISLTFAYVTGTWQVAFAGSGGSVVRTLTASGTNVTAAGQFTSISFTPLTEYSYIYMQSLKATVNCFLERTRISTPKGEVAVEALMPGDVICTADGGETTVKWVGRQDIATRFVMPEKVNPICIKAGALGDGVPKRDLYMTGDHALLIDGLLINASCLTNGRSIYQVERMPLDGFSYYHVETDAHELLLAEGVAAETFIDYVGRDTFHNADEHSAMYPDQAPIAEMDLPRISAKRLVPDATKRHLNARAEKLFPARQSKRVAAA